MDRNELLKYKGKKVSVYQLGNDRLQFGQITDVKNEVFRLSNNKFGPIYNESVFAIGDYYA